MRSGNSRLAAKCGIPLYVNQIPALTLHLRGELIQCVFRVLLQNRMSRAEANLHVGDCLVLVKIVDRISDGSGLRTGLLRGLLCLVGGVASRGRMLIGDHRLVLGFADSCLGPCVYVLDLLRILRVS